MEEVEPTIARSIKVLLVEDVDTDAQLALYELKRHGLTVSSRRVCTEADFRTALADFLPDVILSDYSMPRFDGLEALRLARELAPDVPFIFLSGSVSQEDTLCALKKGATDYLNKNDLTLLGAAVEKAVRDARRR